MARIASGMLLAALLAPGAALADPLDDAKGMAAEGKAALEKANKAKPADKPALLAEGLKKYSRAYLLLTRRKLQNDAPDLLQEISDQIAQANALPEVAAMRRDLLKKAIDASVDGQLTQAYDQLAALRELDPREWTVEYALTVIGQRMEGG
jgi:hypothetical protein